MAKFAKLFEFDDLGQVLVTLIQNDDGMPCLNFRIESVDGLIPECAVCFEDNDEGWTKAEKNFSDISEPQARDTATQLKATITELAS